MSIRVQYWRRGAQVPHILRINKRNLRYGSSIEFNDIGIFFDGELVDILRRDGAHEMDIGERVRVFDMDAVPHVGVSRCIWDKKY